MWRPRFGLFLVLFLPAPAFLTGAGFAAAATTAADERPLRIAVAANFRNAGESLAAAFSEASGIAVELSSASTGVLAAQLRRGAPHDLLLAADRDRPLALVRENVAVDARCYAIGSLVLLGADSLAALGEAHRSIAIANPATAPYGTAALEVLNRPEFPGPAERRVLRGSNVMQAMQFYRSGAVDLALVARSLSPQTGVAIPASWHSEITQFAVISAASSQLAQARRFLEFLTDPESAAVLNSLGYAACS